MLFVSFFIRKRFIKKGVGERCIKIDNSKMTREIPDNDPVKGMGLLRDVVLVLTTRAASSPIHRVVPHASQERHIEILSIGY